MEHVCGTVEYIWERGLDHSWNTSSGAWNTCLEEQVEHMKGVRQRLEHVCGTMVAEAEMEQE